MTRTRRSSFACWLPAARLALPAAVLCALAGGCAKNPPTPSTQPTGAAPIVPSMNMHARVHDLQEGINDLDALVAQLPGRSETNHRELMRDFFGKLAEVLPLAEGTPASGDFQNILIIVKSTQMQLSNSAMDLALEPTIDTGLRSVQRELIIANRDVYSSDADIAKGIDDLRLKIDGLDNLRGPLHRVAVGQAASVVVGVLRQMTQILSDNAGALPSTQPATVPTTVPATTPSAPAAEAPKADAPKPDAPKAEEPKPDAPKPDMPKPDAPKPDAPDAPKPDAPKPDAPKPDAPDAPKPDAPKADSPSTPAPSELSK